jgi:putative ABC transport system permease protein
MKSGRNYQFKNGDAIALKKIDELEVISPENQLGDYGNSNNVIRGLKVGNFEVLGEYPSITKIENIKLQSGRFINQNDIDEKRKVCVIGPRVVETLYSKTEQPIGSFIKINGVNFKVIGVNTPQGNGQRYMEGSRKIRVPFTTFQNAFHMGDHITWFSLLAKKGIPASIAEEKAITVLKERHKIAPIDQQAVGHWNTEVQYNKMNGLFNGIDWLIWFVGSGTLIAGVIGVSNIMLIVVKERTKEIGVKRAIGATPISVISQIMVESLFLTSLAGLSGLGLGLLIIQLLNKNLPPSRDSMFANPTVDLTVIIGSLLILVISGTFAGLIPARKAVAINPVEALRYE